MSRPLKHPSKVKTKHVIMSVTEKEYLQIKRTAKRRRQTVSGYLRQTLNLEP